MVPTHVLFGEMEVVESERWLPDGDWRAHHGEFVASARRYSASIASVTVVIASGQIDLNRVTGPSPPELTNTSPVRCNVRSKLHNVASAPSVLNSNPTRSAGNVRNTLSIVGTLTCVFARG